MYIYIVMLHCRPRSPFDRKCPAPRHGASRAESPSAMCGRFLELLLIGESETVEDLKTTRTKRLPYVPKA